MCLINPWAAVPLLCVVSVVIELAGSDLELSLSCSGPVVGEETRTMKRRRRVWVVDERDCLTDWVLDGQYFEFTSGPLG